MRVQIESRNVKVDDDSRKYVEDVLLNLENKYDWIKEAVVYFKIENESHDRGKKVEILLRIPERELYAEGMEENFGKAINEAYQGLKNQLQKLKGKEFLHPKGATPLKY